jgi:hypothetical protein
MFIDSYNSWRKPFIVLARVCGPLNTTPFIFNLPSHTSLPCQDNEAGIPIATPINPLVDGVQGYVSYQRIVDSATHTVYGLSAFIFQVQFLRVCFRCAPYQAPMVAAGCTVSSSESS